MTIVIPAMSVTIVVADAPIAGAEAAIAMNKPAVTNPPPFSPRSRVLDSRNAGNCQRRR